MPGFLCPRRRAGVCDQVMADFPGFALIAVLCPRCRAGVCDQLRLCVRVVPGGFLCPRCRAGVCDRLILRATTTSGSGVYALGVGLGFATTASSLLSVAPRRVSMPSVSGWGLRR